MNPRIDDDVKKARGTFRKDRELPPAHAPGESKPRRPANMLKYAAQFWGRHFDSLWDQGWLSRQNLDSFITLCYIFQDLQELKTDIEENGRFEVVSTQFTSKTVDRPQWASYQKVRGDFFKWLQETGITAASERRYLLGDKKAEKDKAKETGKKPANIRDFINAG